MTSFHNPLSRQRPTGFSERVAEIKAWMRAALDLGDEVVISINELACGDPGCPPRQTAILVLFPSTPAKRYAVHKSVLDISESDILDAVNHAAI